jgi:hypothetical protein
MDIIPTHSTASPVEVPYLIDDSHPYVYDNKGMVGFPERMGWKLQELREVLAGQSTQNLDQTPKRAASLVQAWLYFGLIHFVTTLHVETSQYLRYIGDGRHVVTLKQLSSQVERWKKVVETRTSEENGNYVQAMDSSITSLNQIFTRYMGLSTSVIPSEVSSSIIVLFRILMSAKNSIFVNSVLPRDILVGDFLSRLQTDLISYGWCKADINRLTQRLSCLHLYCLRSLGSRKAFRDHSSCVNEQCQVRDSTPRSGLRCTCKFIECVSEKVALITAQGDVPLVIFTPQMELKIQPVEQSKAGAVVPYIAISHICADGLGDYNKNIMYPCQLKLLQERVNTVFARLLNKYGVLPELFPALFWVDTLCVTGKSGPERTKAVSAMQKIYQGATAVLVLDRDLEYVTPDLSRLEKTILITTSIWWTRMWTLQEGIFAKELYFQLDEGPISLDDLAKSRDPDEQQEVGKFFSLKRQMTGDLIRKLKELSPSLLRIYEGRHLLRNIAWRFVSRPSDENVCLSILLGKDVAAIENLPDDPIERLKKFILMQRHFPSFFLFLWDAGQEDGFRWAPRTFLGRKSIIAPTYALRDDSEYPDGHSTPITVDNSFADDAGFHVEYPGLILDLSHDFRLRSGQEYVLGLHSDSDGGYYEVHLVTGEPSRSWGRFRELLRPALILPRPCSPLNLMVVGRLVSVYHEGDKLFARIQCPVIVICRVMPASEKLLESNREHYVRASTLKETQKWCVG